MFEQTSGPSEGKDNRTDLTELVNRCQRHLCTDNYCLRRDRATGRMKCRFGFPQQAKQQAEIAKNDKNQWVFLPQRQDCDRDLNKYCPIALSIWRANIDASAIITKDALINYIGKYATKAEKDSDALVAEMRQLATQNDPADGVGRLLAQMMNKFVIQRDFSAQEAAHQLQSLPMIECSRTFETINLVQELTDSQVLDRRTGTERRRRGGDSSKLELYMARPPEMEGLSYYETVKSFTYNKRQGTWRPRERDAIVQIIPHGWYKCSHSYMHV